jgi:hypothetical protein
MIPHLPQKDVPKEEFTRELNLIFNIYDYIEHLRLQGGETFIHAEACELLKETGKYREHFGRAIIATNATYVLNEKIFDTLKELPYEYTLFINEYGKHSKKYNELVEQCDVNHIPYTVHHYNETEQYYGGWFDLSFCKEPLENSTEERFFNCSNRIECKIVQNGKLYGCAIIAAWYVLGLIPHSSDDYVDLNPNLPIEEIRLRASKLGQRPFGGCDHCAGYCPETGKRIMAAEQMEE